MLDARYVYAGVINITITVYIILAVSGDRCEHPHALKYPHHQFCSIDRDSNRIRSRRPAWDQAFGGRGFQ
jgi:hypothetical protein